MDVFRKFSIRYEWIHAQIFGVRCGMCEKRTHRPHNRIYNMFIDQIWVCSEPCQKNTELLIKHDADILNYRISNKKPLMQPQDKYLLKCTIANCDKTAIQKCNKCSKQFCKQHSETRNIMLSKKTWFCNDCKHI